MIQLYTVWFYSYDSKTGTNKRRYDVFTGSKYQCQKFKKAKCFSYQYRIFKSDF